MNDLSDDMPERLSLSSTRVGDALLRVSSYSPAKHEYLKVASAILGPTFQIPIAADGGVLSETYANLPDSKIADLMSCCNGIAQCERKAGTKEEALLWLEEVELLYLNARLSRQPKLYDWTPWFPDNVNISIQFARARALAANIFLDIFNTGVVLHRRWRGNKLIPASHKLVVPEITRTIMAGLALRGLFHFRHPDPMIDQRIRDPSLQVLGSWRKLKVKKVGGPGRRMNFSGFIWDGHLYIAGGRQDSLGPFHRDLFSLDLTTLDGWRTLPDYPQVMSRTNAFVGWNIIPCTEHEKAYLFTGRPVIDFFNLTTKTWGSIMTKFVRSEPGDTQAGIAAWPYPGNQLTDSTQQIIGEKLYVFGGTHANTTIGCNLFTVLDLRTKEWRRLSGTTMPPKDADVSIPGPRKTPNSWHDHAGNKFYLIFGESERMGASLNGELHGRECGYAFEDFWSWDIAAGKWTRERMVGNVPCPRSDAGCVYNPVLNKTIVWGGYNPELPTDFASNNTSFSFTYFAETFMYDGPRAEDVSSNSSRRKWTQVLTQGFPTYRTQSQLLVDPQSGKTYLFGGFANKDYVPDPKTAFTQSLGDLWELRIDLPGGHFEGVDIKDEKRTAQLGPWQRCFRCGDAGYWKKCGGSCCGRAFFCDTDCLKAGWKEHKAAHGCRKVG
ncbi:hypothetical protein BDZ97DRAFT_1064881 [Flammula alnicola]|nr:hypothetical protein BDZ97DRAFT_1064881 [Flammula alnicola]